MYHPRKAGRTRPGKGRYLALRSSSMLMPAMVVFELLIGIVMLVGLAGTIVPILPGLPLIVGAGFAWAFFGDAGVVGWVVAVIIAAIGTVGWVIGTALPARRTAATGVPRWVLVVTAAGVVVGFFVIPVVGALVGGPIALFLAEVVRIRDLKEAWRSTVEALKGIGLGMAVHALAAVLMVAVWGAAVLVW
jgi:uncharacterized protein YqgC (DUF456 family)